MQWIHRLFQAIKLLGLRVHDKASRRQDVGFQLYCIKRKRGTSQSDLCPEFPRLGLSQNLSSHRSLRMPMPDIDSHNSKFVQAKEDYAS